MTANLWGLRSPKPLAPPHTGDAALDAALGALAAYSSTPAQDRLIAKAGARLIPLLDDSALDAGSWTASDRVRAKLGSQKRAYTTLSEQLHREHQIRLAYLRAVATAVAETPKGCTHLVAIAASERHAPEVRWLIAHAVRASGNRGGLALLAKQLHPGTWDGKREEQEGVVRLGADAWFRLGSKVAFDELAPLVADRTTPAKRARARCILHALPYAPEDRERGDRSVRLATLDPRWAQVIAPMIDDEVVDFIVTFALLTLPPEPHALAPFVKTLGSRPDKVSYLAETDIRLLAHLADRTVVPWLLRALQTNASAAHYALEGLRTAGDPAAVPALEAWGKTAKDAKHKRLAKQVATELAKRGPIPPTALGLGSTKSKPVKPKRRRPPGS